MGSARGKAICRRRNDARLAPRIRAHRHGYFSALREYGIRAGAHVRNGTLAVPTCWYRGAVANITVESELHADNMEPTEIQARATIAAALILSRAVEVPSIPTSGDWSQDTAALRLRDLTDYVYQMITSCKNR